MRSLAPAVVAALLAACTTYEDYQTHERHLTVAADPVPCADGTPGSCMEVTDADGDSWVTGQNEIAGFTYEPGFRYELLVEESSEHSEYEEQAPPQLRLLQVVSRQGAGEAGPALDADLGGKRWTLSAIEPSDHPASDWAGSGITAEFDPQAGRLSGFAGCNAYSAALEVTSDQLQVAPPSASRRACPSALLGALEQEYLQRIAGATAFAITEGRLDLSLADGSGMAFHAEP